ncbi:MAG: glycosyltransferase family 87 protein, partial [Pseudomonadota bacterium]
MLNTLPNIRKVALFLLLLLALFYTYKSVWSDEYLRGLDAQVLYLAGVTWADGQSAYDRSAYAASFDAFTEEHGERDSLRRSVFVSPPTIAPLALGMATLGWPEAIAALEILQVISYMALAYFCIMIAKRPTERSVPLDEYTVFTVIVGFCFGAVNSTMLFGQTAIIALAGALGAIYAWQQRRHVLLIAMIFVATIKPQVSLLFLLFLFGAGAWRPIVVSAVIALLLLIALEASSGITMIPAHIAESFADYGRHPFN